jgi:hypothetical protein
MKNWTDQPDCINDAIVLYSAHVGDGYMGEIRRTIENQYFITFGNLFSSQTFACRNIDVVFAMLRLAQKRGEGKTVRSLPEGADLIE